MFGRKVAVYFLKRGVAVLFVVYSLILLVEDVGKFDVADSQLNAESQQREFNYASRAREVLDAGLPYFCRSSVVNSDLVLVLYFLGSLNQVSNYEEWYVWHEAGLRFLRSAVSCMPGDSNIWFREALVSRAAEPNIKSFCDKLAFSRSLSPSEDYLIFARLEIYNTLSEKEINMCKSSIISDVFVAYNFGATEGKDLLNKLRGSEAFDELKRSTIFR